jgi:hypothetical protein
MSFKYKVGKNIIALFTTFTVGDWIGVFSKEQYKE